MSTEREFIYWMISANIHKSSVNTHAILFIPMPTEKLFQDKNIKALEAKQDDLININYNLID